MSKSPPDDLGQTYLHRLSVAANTLMSTGFWLTTGVFGVLTIISILGGQFQQIMSIESLVWKLIISSYFVSWVVGVKFDKTREEYVYNTAPSQVKLDITSIHSCGCCILVIWYNVCYRWINLVHDRR